MSVVQKLLFIALMLSLIWVGVSTAQLADSPWPMYGHDPQHTGRSPYNGPETPGTKWKVETGDRVESSPAIGVDGTVYVGSNDHHLYAIHPDGSLKWKYETGAFIYYSSPAIGSDGTVYVTSGDGYLYTINSDGSLKWKYEYEPGDVQWPSPSSPAIGSDGTIYVGSGDSHVHAVHPDGSLKWKYETGDAVWSCPAIGPDGTVYAKSADHNFYAIHPDGSLKWKYEIRHQDTGSAAIGADGTVYVTLQLGPDFRPLHAIHPDGSVKWKCEDVGHGSGGICSLSIGSNRIIYVGSGDGHLYAVNSDGSLEWKYETEGSIFSCPAIGADGTIYVGSDDKRLYAIDSDGSLKWKYRTGGSINSSVAIGPNNTLYVGSQDHNLYAIHVGDEQEVEIVPTADLVMYEEGPGDGCTIKASSKADNDPYATTVAHSGDNAHAITIQRPGEKIPGKVTYTFADPDGIVLSWYTHLSFWIYPGDADIQKLLVDAGGRGRTEDGNVRILKPDLVGGMGMDLSGDRWIEVRIPLEDLCGENERMPFLTLGGTVTGTFYVDDMKLELAEAEPTAVEGSDDVALPSGYALSQNYPNPFNPETTLRYDMAEGGTVRLSIYALTGQLVRTLVDGGHPAGSYSVIWDGTDDAGRDVASGVYLCQMEARAYRAVRKLALVR